MLERPNNCDYPADERPAQKDVERRNRECVWMVAAESKSGGSQIHNHGQDEQQKHQHREAESSHRDAIGRGGFWQRRRGQVHHEQNTGTNRSRAQKRIQRGSYRAELTTKGII